MLSENLDRWEEQFRQEGRQEGRHEGEVAMLRRQLRKRFGDVPDWVQVALAEASPDQLEEWGERLLEVSALSELFEGSEPNGSRPAGSRIRAATARSASAGRRCCPWPASPSIMSP